MLTTEDDKNPDNRIIRSDVEDFITDEKIDLSDSAGNKRKIGV